MCIRDSYVYGAIGGRVSVSTAPDLANRVSAAYTAHRGRRDQVTAMVRAAGGTPVAADISYQLPNSAKTAGQQASAALEIERRCTAVYADMVASTAQANRQWAIDALTDAAVRQLGFGGTPEVFPGIPEL